MRTVKRTARRRASGLIAVVFGVGCASGTGQPPAAASATREMRVAHDLGLGGLGPGLLIAVGPDGHVRGAAFVRAHAPISGLPDSIAALLRAERKASFARAGCSEPVDMDFALACALRFGRWEPDWRMALRVVDSTLAADSAAERAAESARRPAVQPDGTIRIRGCNDCGGVFAEIREAGRVRSWRLGSDAAARLGRLTDSLVASAAVQKR